MYLLGHTDIDLLLIYADMDTYIWIYVYISV